MNTTAEVFLWGTRVGIINIFTAGSSGKLCRRSTR